MSYVPCVDRVIMRVVLREAGRLRRERFRIPAARLARLAASAWHLGQISSRRVGHAAAHLGMPVCGGNPRWREVTPELLAEFRRRLGLDGRQEDAAAEEVRHDL